MTKLNYTVTLDDTCNLTVTDISGFYDVDSNPNGFLPETNTDSPVFGVYKLSQGYFLNVLLYNKFNVAPLITNATEGFYQVDLPVDDVYVDNFTPTVYNLTSDGTYTLKRFFIISDVYYNSVVDTGVFTSRDVYYTDGTSIFLATNGDVSSITITSFLAASMTNATVLELDNLFISTCHINNCYFKLMNSLIDSSLNDCVNTITAKYMADRDLLYMTLEVIKYLQAFNNLTQIQKLIEAVDGCCSVCDTIPSNTGSQNGGCGCSG